jgi:hypothetical protein
VRQAVAVFGLAVIFNHRLNGDCRAPEVARLVHEHFTDQPLYRRNEIAQAHRFHQRFMA